MTDISLFECEVNKNGLQNYLFNSFKEAKESGKEYSIVYMPNVESGYFDIYLTAIKDGEFGEYVCWVEDEFKDNADLIYVVLGYITGAYVDGDVGENLNNLNPYVKFKSYRILDN